MIRQKYPRAKRIKFGYGDKFIHMIEVAYTNIHSETKIKMVSYLILLPLYEEFAWGVLILLYITVTEVHANSIDADTRYFGNFVLDNLNWDKISHSLTKKKSIFGTECNSL